MEALSQEEKLTLLLTHIFDWIEAENGHLLYFDGVNLRGAIERYYYFEGMVRPRTLRALLEYCKPWRVTNKDSIVTTIYDSYVEVFEKASFYRKVTDTLISWFRIGIDYCRYYKGKICGDKLARDGRLRVGFFVISSRFVNFFQAFDRKLDFEQKLYFSPSLYKSLAGSCTPVFAADHGFPNTFSKIPVKLNHKLFPVIFRLCFYFARIKNALAYSSPDVLVFAEGTSHYDELASLAALELEIPTIRLQSGRAALLHTGYRNMKFNAMLNWGDGFSKRYGSVSPSAKQIVCGCPLLDDVIEQIDIDKSQKNVIIFTQPVVEGVLLKSDYLKLVQLAERLLNLDEDINLLVRMHPADTRKDFFDIVSNSGGRVQFLNAPEYTLSEVMSRGICAVSFSSTTLSESAASGVIPILIKLEYQEKMFPFPEDYGAVVVVDSVAAATGVIEKITTYPEEWVQIRESMKEFGENFFGPRDRMALSRVTQFIRTTAKGRKIEC